MNHSFFTLLKNGHLYAPEDQGIKDILLGGQTIIAIGENLPLPANYECEVINLSGQLVMPGLIDSHVHIIGGGGEGGFKTRTPEVTLSAITTSGVTTVIGCLGTDGVCRHPESLLAKARGLEEEGITTYIYSGAYQLPTPTFTGSVRKDIMLIDKCLGVGEIAMSDHRSAQPSCEDFRKIIAEARVGGMLSNKAGIVDIHMGDGIDGLKMLWDITANREIPKSQVLPTHCNRNPNLFSESINWAKEGGFIDVTSGIQPVNDSDHCLKSSIAVRKAIDAGVPFSQITMSSDGNGSMPLFDEEGHTIGVGVGSQKTLLSELADMVTKEQLPLADVLTIVTSNVARLFKLPQKGRLAPHLDADLIVVDTDFKLQHVWTLGQQMVKDGQPIVLGTFE